MNDRLDASDLLEVWERGLKVSAVERPLDLLSSADSPQSRKEIALLPLGRRDAALFELRLRIFGQKVVCTATCPACNERLHVSLDLGVLMVDSPKGQHGVVNIEDLRIEFRLPTTADLIEASRDGAVSPETLRLALLARCVLSIVDAAGRCEQISDLSDDGIARVIAGMAAADPQADVTLDLSCPTCPNRWLEPFDIASFLWIELDSLARRLLREVATLASVYGWSEFEVLRLSSTRRHHYLELAGK